MEKVKTQIISARAPLVWFVTMTVIFATMYGLIQQQDRLAANDMPTMLATETAHLIDSGVDAEAVGNTSPIDIASSRVPFTVVYDKQGKPISGSGYLDKKLAQLPIGALKATESGDVHSVTWQPKTSLRFATTTVKTKDYYVMSGQSLEAVEARASKLLVITAAGYGLSLLAMAGYYALAVPEQARRRKQSK